MQSQDYGGASWALAMRTGGGITEDDVDRAMQEGRIPRTHVMRPTWHFVAAADIRWLLSLTATRVHAVNGCYYRQHDLDAKVFARSHRAFVRALGGGRHLTRIELAAVLERAGISAEGQRLGLLMMNAELDQVICSGPRRGKQFTYALLDERAPNARVLERDGALAELTRRYFTSHGPATVRDFVWWSGLTVRDANAGLEMWPKLFAKETVGERTYWFVPPAARVSRKSTCVHLLPNYDEYLIAYKDRGDPLAPTAKPRPAAQRPENFGHHLVIDGRVVGTWTRTRVGGKVVVRVRPFKDVTPAEARKVAGEVRRLGTFMRLPASVALDK